jgi:hypothetical protein
MEKSKTEQKFDDLMSHIFTFFKPLGYKKKGNNFRFYDRENGWGKIVNFQKSSLYDKQHIHFTVNTGIYFADYEYYMWNKKSGEQFTEPMCAVRNRIGRINNQNDQWYDINEEIDFEKLKGELARDFTKVISFFNKVKTKEDVIIQIIISNSDFPCGKIKTLFYNGQRERALNFLDQEMKRANELYKPTLEKLKQELTCQQNIFTN